MKEIYKLVIFLIVILFFTSCDQFVPSDEIQDGITLKVQADAETEPVSENVDEDAADDPAIWLHPDDPGKSTVIGTNKKGGLAVYDLGGKQLHYYPVGNVNNVDVRCGFPLDGDTIDIVGASNRSDSSISLMKVDPESRGLVNIAGNKIISGTGEVYGFCFYKSPKTGKFFALVNSKKGKFEQWELFAKNGRIDGKPVRNFDVGGQVEGMVCDDELGNLFIGEELNGIWKYDAEPEGGDLRVKVPDSDETNPNITYDMEGLCIYYAPNGRGYLIASSQGNFSYAVFQRSGTNSYIASFRIVSGKYDGAEETDGIDVISHGLGSKFTNGLFVVQDGFNFDGEEKHAQNFKYVSWEKIASTTDPPLLVAPDYNVCR